MDKKRVKIWPVKRIIPHLLFWLFYVLFFGLFYGKYGHDYRLHLIETSCMLPFVMVATYTTIYVILPFYLKTRKPVPSVFMAVVLLVLITLGERIFIRYLNGLPINTETLFGISSLYLMLETNFMVALGFTVKFLKKWFEQQQEKHEMEKKHLQSELNVLKAQLNPHFLFNTMNNLYALSIEKSSKTSEGIAKISDLLRSVLYECNDSEMALYKEVKLIENYIDLEKMRYGDQLNVSFTVTGSVEDAKIAPMMLFTFVENCFKHGSSNFETPFITIKLDVNENEIFFESENSKPPYQKQVMERNIGGIGLANVKKRLEILYPGNYELICGDKNCCYKVSLRIKRMMRRKAI
ncbi:histidine kinase [Prolixibacteraceae bacterium Z1-6]|uniref:Histidine kinase n=1 Tax=Draconibacterium aestuarii TaxID=2998507 RepID=A0A9X3J997_9BACT|nr:histidine kinase [Prolixibacteraceae bacterium Z1-6]